MIKLPFSQQEHLFPNSLAKVKHGCFPLTLERDPKNIFYYQRDAENYTDQVLDFLFDRREYIHTESSNLVSMFMLPAYVTFSLFFTI